jgi:hypothetical protein
MCYGPNGKRTYQESMEKVKSQFRLQPGLLSVIVMDNFGFGPMPPSGPIFKFAKVDLGPFSMFDVQKPSAGNDWLSNLKRDSIMMANKWKAVLEEKALIAWVARHEKACADASIHALNRESFLERIGTLESYNS